MIKEHLPVKRTLASLCLWTFWSVSSLGASLQNNIDALIQKINPNVNLGMVVYDFTSGETLYTRNADKLFIPASNMKLFSEAATLMALGSDYRFKNQLSTNASQLDQGILKGNLYLHLSGDPSFSRDDLHSLLDSLRAWNIKKIQGNVIVESSLTSIPAYPPGWLTADLSYSYGAPIAPLMIDNNRLTVRVNPGAKADDPALIEIDDGGGTIVLKNQVLTKASGKGCGVGFTLDPENELTVRGCVEVGQWAVQQRLPIKHPFKFIQGMIQSELAKENIQIEGEIVLDKAPAGTLLLATQYSKPLVQLMADTLKPSDNLYADSLYLHAAAKLNKAPVNWDGAQALIKNFLQQQTGIELSQSVFTDGSGLSRYNLVTPQQTITLLKFLYRRFPLAYEYIAALPVSGRDGTLQKRFKNPNQQGFVRAKTGTMTGVNSLSGYLYTANGHTLAFAFYINKLPGKNSGPGRPLMDALVDYFLQLNPGNNHLAQVFTPTQKANYHVQLTPTESDLQKSKQMKWRRLESAVRAALKNQAVNVVFRGNELFIRDNQSDANLVWSTLQALGKKYVFAVALSSESLTFKPEGHPMMLWMHTDTTPRTWMIREAI